MLLRLIAFFAVAALLVFGGPERAIAQEATPSAGADFEIVPLAEVQTTDLPSAPAFLGLARFGFPPGAATPAGADPGSVLVVVEMGDFVAALDGPAAIGRGAAGASAATTGEEISLQPGDTVFVPAGTSSTFRNAGQTSASLLAVMIFPEDPFGSAARTSIDGVAVELLAGGMVDSLPSTANLTLAHATFAPGVDLPPSPAQGPALALLLAGSLTYAMTTGESVVSRGARAVGSGRQPTEPVAPTTDVSLATGDAFIEETGTVSGLRNAGDTRAELLVVFFSPTEDAVAATPAG